MERNAVKTMQNWKSDANRKPLVLKGARQTGKTWLMKEFGRLFYNDVFYFNFDEEDELKSIFEQNKEPLRIIELLGLIRNQKILPNKHLIIFDEIQECPAALNCLKYFCEKANEYHIVSAGSLLGTLLAQPKSYPVGKVNLLNISPMTFDEFLAAIDNYLYNYYMSAAKERPVETIFHNKLLEAYGYYLIIGGMPECVKIWAETKNPAKVNQIQSELITLYENDFSKYNGTVNSGRILMTFRSIVTQLAKENKKFVYGCIKEGARAREFEEAIEWLVSSGLVAKIYNVSKPEHPLNVFSQLNNFKLFLFDTGLLKHMAGLSNEAILLKYDYQFKGALTENYVLQQIRNIYETEPKFYASPSANGEIDFLIQDGLDIIPIEVKSGENTISHSFRNYLKKNNPEKAVMFSKLPYKTNPNFTNIPLYFAGKMQDFI